MSELNQIFKIKESSGSLNRPERQSIEQTEDYAFKQVVFTRELVVDKLILDKATNTYFEYNTATGEVELYVGGVIKMSW